MHGYLLSTLSKVVRFTPHKRTLSSVQFKIITTIQSCTYLCEHASCLAFIYIFTNITYALNCVSLIILLISNQHNLVKRSIFDLALATLNRLCNFRLVRLLHHRLLSHLLRHCCFLPNLNLWLRGRRSSTHLK